MTGVLTYGVPVKVRTHSVLTLGLRQAGSPWAHAKLNTEDNKPTPALFKSGYTSPEATIKWNIALDHILRRVVSGPKICP